MRRFVVIACVFALTLWAARSARNLGVDAYVDEVEHPETDLLPDGDEKTEFAFAYRLAITEIAERR